jgi:hypothetical protein
MHLFTFMLLCYLADHSRGQTSAVHRASTLQCKNAIPICEVLSERLLFVVGRGDGAIANSGATIGRASSRPRSYTATHHNCHAFEAIRTSERTADCTLRQRARLSRPASSSAGTVSEHGMVRLTWNSQIVRTSSGPATTHAIFRAAAAGCTGSDPDLHPRKMARRLRPQCSTASQVPRKAGVPWCEACSRFQGGSARTSAIRSLERVLFGLGALARHSWHLQQTPPARF